MKRMMKWVLGVCVSAAMFASAAEVVDGQGRSIDLSPYYTTRFDAPGYDKAGKQLPSINPVFDGLRFDLRGQMTLWGRTMAERHEFFYLPAVRGVPVGAKFEELHLCHHARWTDAVGRTIARVRLNYADGSRHEFPIVFGTHVRDWFFLPSYEDETLGDPEAKVIWRDPEADNNNLRGFRRLWKTRFLNPHPERTVVTMDFESAKSFAHYSVVAATIAARDDGRQRTPSIPFDQPRRRFTGKIEITVLDQDTGKPLPGVVVDPGTVTRGASVVAEMVVTDAEGRATFRYWEEETSRVYLRVRADGYEPAFKHWDGVIGDTAVFHLRRGKTIGGVLVDDESRPVEGASVVLGMLVSCTDEAGRWSLSGVGSSYYSRLEVGHPGFATVSFRMGADVPIADLERRAAKLKIDQGHYVTGRVMDAAGKPVVGASVTLGRAASGLSQQKTDSDAEGWFVFPAVPLGDHVVTASAPASGLAATSVSVAVGREKTPLIVVLKAGRTVQGRVVDENGAPLADVQIYGRPLSSPRLSQFRFTTGADGQLRWETAPEAPVTLMFHKHGLLTRNETVSPGRQKDLTVTMSAVRSVNGVVVDAGTGAPIPRFTVRLGHSYGGDQVSFIGPDPMSGREGRFELKLDRLSANADGIVAVEAEGYVPVLSDNFSATAPPKELHFRLERGESPEGVVLRPDGRPAVGARVALEGRGSQLQLRDGRLFTYGMARLQEGGADREGHFRTPPQPDPKRLVAAHESGYAEVVFTEFKKGDTIRLRPWGSVTGTLTENGEPLTNAPVTFSRALQGGVAVNLQFNGVPLWTDARGRVSIHYVPAGNFRFVRMMEVSIGGGRSWTHMNEQPVTVRAGETAMVNLDVGLKLRAVTGRITVPDWKSDERADIKVELRGHTPVKPMGRKIPGAAPHPRSLGDLGYVNPRFEPEVDADGRFRIDEVPTGRYTLFATLQGEPVVGTALRRSLGHVGVAVEVLADAPDQETPQELGDYEILLELREGDTAPPIEAVTVEGKPFKLADYRGRFVLLDFWATWCGPCLQETPNLKAVHEEFGGDERFALVGLSLDHSIGAPRRYAAEN